MLFWLTNPYCTEIKELLNLHRIVKRYVKCFSIESNILLVLFDVVAFNIFDMELDLLDEFLLNFSVELDVDLDILARLKHAFGR